MNQISERVNRYGDFGGCEYFRGYGRVDRF